MKSKINRMKIWIQKKIQVKNTQIMDSIKTKIKIKKKKSLKWKIKIL